MTAPSGTTVFTRADVLRLGREGSPVQFLPIALQALRVAPADDAIRLLAATVAENWGQLTLARELWTGLQPATAAMPEVRQIAERSVAVLGRAGDDAASAGAFEEARARLVEARPELRAAIEAMADFGTVHSGRDGSRLWRSAAGVWRGFGPLVQEATAAAVGLGTHASGFAPPVVVAGVEPATVLLAVLRGTAAERIGYAVRVSVVEPEVGALIAACVCVPELVEAIKSERVELFVGPACLGALEAAWAQRLACTLPAKVLSVQGGLRAQVSEIVGSVHGAQQAEFAERLARVKAEERAVGAVRTALVLTSRYTTFVRHSVDGLVAALERAGVRTRVLMEPDGFSTLSGVAYLREVMEHPPDMVIGSNCTRAWFGEILPTQVPFVAWIQDAIPKLFEPATALAQGPRDVMVGYVFGELADQHGFDRERMHYSGVPIDEARFHRGPVTVDEREQFSCDVTMVSHHSETPEAMYRRLLDEIAVDDGMRGLLARVYPSVADAVVHANVDWPFSRLRRAIRAETIGGRPIPETLVMNVLRQFSLPLADRMLRHESLAWAAQLADERGWTMHLYGNGWEKHPTLARFAKGPLAHGDELRAAYQCAALNLHVSMTTLVHQRVSECALSGGLCVARYHRDGISGPRATAMLELIEREPDVVDEANERIGYRVADHAAAMRQHLLFTRLGEPTDGEFVWVNAVRATRAKAQRRLIDHDQDANELFGDLAALTFQDREGLGRLVERARERDSWRGAHSRAVARFARRRLSFDTLVRRMLDGVRVTGLARPALRVIERVG